MELTGEKVFDASRARLFDALHNPRLLSQAIPGCLELNRLTDDRYQATIAVDVGPVRASFFGTITIYGRDPPFGYSLRAEASGGLSGSASGDAHVALATIEEARTNLAYHIDANLKGQLGSVGRGLLESAARTLIGEFLARLDAALDVSRTIATSRSLTDATGAPTMMRETGSAPVDPLADESAYSASSYLSSPEPPAHAVNSDVPGRLQAASAAQVVTFPPLAAPPADGTRTPPGRDGDPLSAPRDRLPPLPPRQSAPHRLETLGDPRLDTRSQRKAAPQDTDGRMTPWRWVLVAFGVASIAALLSGAI